MPKSNLGQCLPEKHRAINWRSSRSRLRLCRNIIIIYRHFAWQALKYMYALYNESVYKNIYERKKLYEWSAIIIIIIYKAGEAYGLCENNHQEGIDDGGNIMKRNRQRHCQYDARVAVKATRSNLSSKIIKRVVPDGHGDINNGTE